MQVHEVLTLGPIFCICLHNKLISELLLGVKKTAVALYIVIYTLNCPVL
jgi:hypothetical protein